MSPLKRSDTSFHGNASSPKRLFVGSSSAAGVNSEGSTGNVFEATYRQLDEALSTACSLSLQVPGTAERIDLISNLLQPGQGFDEEAEKETLTAEVSNLEFMQNTLTHLRRSFSLFKTSQDARCRKYEDAASLFIKQMSKDDARDGVDGTRANVSHSDGNVSFNFLFFIHSFLFLSIYLRPYFFCILGDTYHACSHFLH